jgi:hypothetical protein
VAKRYSSPVVTSKSKCRRRGDDDDDSSDDDSEATRSPFGSIGNLNKTSLVSDPSANSHHVRPFFSFSFFIKNLPPYILSGFDITTHISSLLGLQSFDHAARVLLFFLCGPLQVQQTD